MIRLQRSSGWSLGRLPYLTQSNEMNKSKVKINFKQHFMSKNMLL